MNIYIHIYSYSSYELHTRNFSHIHLSVLDASKLKMALQAKNVSGTFEKQALQFKPRPVNALGVMPA